MNPADKKRVLLERLPILIVAVLAVILIVVFVSGDSETERETLQILSASDAAGMIVAYAAGTSPQSEDIFMLRVADCCGTQAELALEAGVFDMAVLCPDAAEMFLAGGGSFVIAGGIVMDANVLVSHGAGMPESIGYTFGRASQREAAKATMGDGITMIPIAPAALPFALARGAVDAAVLDITTALSDEADFIITPLPFYRPSSVLVVNKDIIHTQLYRDFLETYNRLVDQLDEEIIMEIFENEEMATAWTTKLMSFINIG